MEIFYMIKRNSIVEVEGCEARKCKRRKRSNCRQGKREFSNIFESGHVDIYRNRKLIIEVDFEAVRRRRKRIQHVLDDDQNRGFASYCQGQIDKVSRYCKVLDNFINCDFDRPQVTERAKDRRKEVGIVDDLLDLEGQSLEAEKNGKEELKSGNGHLPQCK
jgi:hypothetical protein